VGRLKRAIGATMTIRYTFDICAGTKIAEETLLERPAEEERAPPLEEHRDNILI